MPAPIQWTDAQIDEVKRLRGEGYSLARLGDHFGVSTRAIRRLVKTIGGSAVTDQSKVCESCGETFFRQWGVAHTHWEKRRGCSLPCAMKLQAAIKRAAGQECKGGAALKAKKKAERDALAPRVRDLAKRGCTRAQVCATLGMAEATLRKIIVDHGIDFQRATPLKTHRGLAKVSVDGGAYWLDAARIVARTVGPVFRADIARCRTDADFRKPPTHYIVGNRRVPLPDLLEMARAA